MTEKPFFRPEVEALTPYQPGKPIEDVQRELHLHHVVKVASNEGPFPPFPAALDAMQASDGDLNRYPDGGSFRLHEALAGRHGVHPEEICVGAGADGCIDMLSQATLAPGDEVVCGWPSFPSYAIYAAKQGASARKVPLLDHRYDLEALLRAPFRRRRSSSMSAPPQQPDRDDEHEERELDAFFEKIPADTLVVIDQAYFEYIDRDDYPDAVEAYYKLGRRVVVLRTFSKIYGLAGARVGYAVGPPDVCQAMAKVSAGRSTSRPRPRWLRLQASGTSTRSRGAAS